MEEGAVMLVGLDPERILDAMKVLDMQPAGEGNRTSRMVEDYDAVNVSEKLVRIIVSYTSYVNRVIWKNC
jgi:UDP-N-acetylglucosamine 2-epimerase (non-hydrolysing)